MANSAFGPTADMRRRDQRALERRSGPGFRSGPSHLVEPDVLDELLIRRRNGRDGSCRTSIDSRLVARLPYMRISLQARRCQIVGLDRLEHLRLGASDLR
jgi:hypothetical protein